MFSIVLENGSMCHMLSAISSMVLMSGKMYCRLWNNIHTNQRRKRQPLNRKQINKAVYDVGLLELLDAIQRLQKGQDMAGSDLSGSPQFLVGSTANASAREKALEVELEELKKKMETGVRFFVTPPLFDLASIEPFLKRVDQEGETKIIPTVLLLKSVGMARYIDRHQDQVHIPEGLIERIQGARDKAGECIHIAAEMVSTLKDEGFSGVLISTVGWEDRLSEILEEAGL